MDDNFYINDDIYEVERDDYLAFIGQLNKKLMDVEHCVQDNCTSMKILSKSTGKHLCTRKIIHKEDEDEERYYIFNYPENEERLAPRPIRQITLDTKEDVKAFFDILSKIQKGEIKHDGTVS